ASAVTRRLQNLGIKVSIGHRPDNVTGDVDLVVATAAVKPDNVELVEARRHGVETIKYAQMLGRLMLGRRGVAVSGTHGKSTTAAMIGYVLDSARLSPSFVIGADVPQLGSGARAGDSDVLVVEACEFDRSFLNLKPTVATILNIEEDHLDYYRDKDDIKDAFGEFASRVAPDGLIVANGSDADVHDVLGRARAAVETFGIEGDYLWCATRLDSRDGRYEFDVQCGGEAIGRFRLELLGRHQVSNALAAIAVCNWFGVSAEVMRSSLARFSGVNRRMQTMGTGGGVTVLDDYAHHPTEIHASLTAVKERFPDSKLWCVFQPHQYSRTRFLLKDFARALRVADKVIVPEIYFVRDSEQERQKVSARDLVCEIKEAGGDALFVDSFGGITELLTGRLKPGDVVITMGAGPVWKIAEDILGKIKNQSAEMKTCPP
ncbi:MAG: UDP-N-acetylmuramate--L-alanine ligase, partial [Planctomycetia bacterium]|nr:UDP-N-acetylmuramate--L-alanine ligase [Planctomycetia bacterium]